MLECLEDIVGDSAVVGKFGTLGKFFNHLDDHFSIVITEIVL